MRIASLSSFDASVAQLQRRQEAMTTAQEKLTSGKRVMRPSDDPADAARAERALAAESRAIAQQRALDASRNAMQLTESALGDASELMQQARELMVGAGNGSYTDKERKINAQALRGLRDDLLAVANRTDGAGRYLFGGQGSDGQPLLDKPGGVTYTATGGTTQAAAGEATPLSLDGQAAWLLAPDPRNPGATLSVFDVMDRVATELETAGRTGAEVAQTVSNGLADLDAGVDNLSGWRARAGESLNRIDGIGERLSQAKLDAQRSRSEAEDLDMVAAISDFQSRQSGYDAALKTYSIVQRMSLFEYIK
jgi:flagellar hook-associated protein 3 FlgL